MDGELAFAFDMRSPAWPVIEFPFIGRDWEDVTPTGSSFGGFLERLCEFGRGIGDDTILLEIVRTLRLHDPIFSIYAAEPWTPESRACLWQEDERGSSPSMKQEGLSFFLTTGIAQEFFADARADDLREKCEHLVRYARSGLSCHGTTR